MAGREVARMAEDSMMRVNFMIGENYLLGLSALMAPRRGVSAEIPEVT